MRNLAQADTIVQDAVSIPVNKILANVFSSHFLSPRNKFHPNPTKRKSTVFQRLFHSWKRPYFYCFFHNFPLVWEGCFWYVQQCSMTFFSRVISIFWNTIFSWSIAKPCPKKHFAVICLLLRSRRKQTFILFLLQVRSPFFFKRKNLSVPKPLSKAGLILLISHSMPRKGNFASAFPTVFSRFASLRSFRICLNRQPEISGVPILYSCTPQGKQPPKIRIPQSRLQL